MRQERTETGIKYQALRKDHLHDSRDSGLKGITLPSYSTSTLTCSQKPRQVKPVAWRRARWRRAEGKPAGGTGNPFPAH